MALKKKKGHVIVFARNAPLTGLRVSFKNLGDDLVLCKLKCNFLPRFTGYFLRGSELLDFDFSCRSSNIMQKYFLAIAVYSS